MALNPQTYTLDELRKLPAPVFAERDTDVLKANLVLEFERLTKRTLYPAQTENFMINIMAYALSNIGSAIQNGLMQNRVIWSEGRDLDDLGANVSTFRLKAQRARCEVEFVLSELQATTVVVPAGTRVSAGNGLVFSSVEDLLIPTGNIAGRVDVAAIETGLAFNDLQPGQITDILDPVAHVSAVVNTQISSGGSDVEKDDRFRERIANASDRITRGGSRQGYIELVKAVHPDIVDVKSVRPQPGYIHIYPLMKSGVAPDTIDNAILNYLDPETRIPQGDYVTVHKAAPKVFDVTMTLKVTPGTATGVTAQAHTNIHTVFEAWGQKLGSQIAPSALIEAVRVIPGVVGVSGPAFAFTDLNATEFAVLGELNIDVTEAPNV